MDLSIFSQKYRPEKNLLHFQVVNRAVFSNGDPVIYAGGNKFWKQASKSEIPAYCYFNNDPEEVMLFNFYAVSDPRGLATKDYSVPSVMETKESFTRLLKEQFKSGICSKIRTCDGTFRKSQFSGYVWSSTEVDNGYGNCFRLSDPAELEIKKTAAVKGMGFTVVVVRESRSNLFVGLLTNKLWFRKWKTE
jgi:hypothetical protein